MKSKKLNLNPLDQLINNLFIEFSKIENFNLIQNDPNAKGFFNLVAFRISDILSYKNLVINSFIPAVNKEIIRTKQYINTSVYKSVINKEVYDLNDSYFETIRMAYVVIFHKYESYANELKSMMDVYFQSNADTQGIDFSNFCSKTFNLKLNDWKLTKTLTKINWICNCIKHYDSFPSKPNPPIQFLLAPKDQRLQLTKEDFLDDVKYLNESMTSILRLTLMVHQYWLGMENSIFTPEDDYYSTYVENKQKVFDIINKYIALIKSI